MAYLPWSEDLGFILAIESEINVREIRQRKRLEASFPEAEPRRNIGRLVRLMSVVSKAIVC